MPGHGRHHHRRRRYRDGGVLRGHRGAEPARGHLRPGHDRRAVEHGPVQDRGVPPYPRRRRDRAEGQRHVRGPLRGGRPPRRGRGGARRRGDDHGLASGRRPGLSGHRLLPRHQGRHHRQARLGRVDRPGPVPRRLRFLGVRGSRPPVAGPAADRDAEAAWRRRQRIGGGRRHRQRHRVRAAGRGRDRGRRADRRQFPRGPGTGRRTARPRYDRGHPPLRHRLTGGGRRARAGRAAIPRPTCPGPARRLRRSACRSERRRRRPAGRRPGSPSRGSSWW
jgi:hypothetical protein